MSRLSLWADGTSPPLLASVRGALGRAGVALAERLEAQVARRSSTRPAGTLSLSVVFLRWDAAAGGAFSTLERRVAALPNLDVRYLVVDNAGSGAPLRGVRDVAVVSGDNRAREFSGWARGIEHLRATGEPTDVWLFVNDRFGASPYPFLERLTTGAVQTAHALQAVVGRVDHYPGQVESFGLDVSSWVNTAFYLVPDPVLRRIGGPVFLHPGNLAEVMPEHLGPGSPPFVPGGPVSILHAHHLIAFLGHASDAPHGAHWYRRLEPTEATWPEFRSKVMSILNEQLFSARARAAAVPLLELGLASRLGAMGVENPAIRSALERIRRRPVTEPMALNRVAGRLWLALRALSSTLPVPPLPATVGAASR